MSGGFHTFAKISNNINIKTTLIVLLFSIGAKAQKFDREYFNLQHANIPQKLIYDQIKTYAFSTQSSGEYLPYDAITRNVPGLSSYENVPFANADLKISVVYGPYQIIEEKTNVSTREEEVNKVKVKVNYYSRTLSFRFPITYRAVNSKNGVLLWSADMSNQTIHSIGTSEFRSETEAFNYLNTNKSALLIGKTTEIVNGFTGNQNAYFKRNFDFYPTKELVDIYKFKKWKQDDEYNTHVKNVIKTFEQTTYDEKPSMVISKLQADIDYFNSFEGKFNPTDKDEDILYWGNYYNLATIYYCLDNCDKADFYLTKLIDSSKKQTDNTKGLKNLVNSLRARFTKHYLTDRHFTHNPVKDYRLANQTITSDAASAAESVAGGMSSGAVEANDYIINMENKEVKGKVVVDATKQQIQFIPKDDPSKIEVLSPVSILGFKKDSVVYEVHKNLSNPSNPVKQFYKLVYSSPKIKLLEYVNAVLVPDINYTATLRPKDEGIFFIASLGMKKKLAKYFEDCKEVSDKAGDGDYGKGLNFTIDKFVQMCKDYDACK